MLRTRKGDIAAGYVGVRIEPVSREGLALPSFSVLESYDLLNKGYGLSHDEVTAARLTYFVRGKQFLSVQLPILRDEKYWRLNPAAFCEWRSNSRPGLHIKHVPHGVFSVFQDVQQQPWPIREEICSHIVQNRRPGKAEDSSKKSTLETVEEVHDDDNEQYWQHYTTQRGLFINPIEDFMNKKSSSEGKKRMYRAVQGVPGVFTTSVDVMLREYYQHIEYGLDLGRYSALDLLLIVSSTNLRSQCEHVLYPESLLVESSLKVCAHTSIGVLDKAYYGDSLKQENDLRCACCSRRKEIKMALSYVQRDRETMQATFSEILKFVQLFSGHVSLILWIDKVATRAAIKNGLRESEWIKYGFVPYVVLPVLSTVGASGDKEIEHARKSIWIQMEALAARSALGCYFTKNAKRCYANILATPERQLPTLECGTRISVGKTTGSLCSLKRLLAAVNERESLEPSEYWKKYYEGFRKWALALISSVNEKEDKMVLSFELQEPLKDNWPIRESVLLMHCGQETGGFLAPAMAIDDMYEIGNLETEGWHAAFTYMSREEKSSSWHLDVWQQLRMERLREVFFVGIGDEKRAVFLRVNILDPLGRHTLHLHDVIDLNEDGSQGTVLKVWRIYTSHSRRLIEILLKEESECLHDAMTWVRRKVVAADGIAREGNQLYRLNMYQPNWKGGRDLSSEGKALHPIHSCPDCQDSSSRFQGLPLWLRSKSSVRATRAKGSTQLFFE